MPENIRGDVHVTAQGVRWTYLGSRNRGTVDVTIQPPGEEPSDHTVMQVVWESVASGGKPLGRVTLPPASTTTDAERPSLEGELDSLRGRVAVLEAALREYGEHRPPCALWTTTGDAGPNGEKHPCTCGLGAVLAGGDAAPPRTSQFPQPKMQWIGLSPDDPRNPSVEEKPQRKDTK